MFLVVCYLQCSAATRLVHRPFHRIRHRVGIERHASRRIARRTSDDLDERRLGPEKPFLVGVEHADEGHFGKVETLAEEVHSDKTVEFPFAERSEYLYPVDSLDIAVEILRPDILFLEIPREILRHLLRQGRRDDTAAEPDLEFRLADEITDLPRIDTRFADRSDGNFRVEQSRRTDDLLDDIPAHFPFVLRRRRRREDDGTDVTVEFLEPERPVVERRRKPESVFDKVLLPRLITRIHPADLRNRHMRLIDDREEIRRPVRKMRKIIEKRLRRHSGLAERELSGIVLDAVAVADLRHHREIVIRPPLEPFRLEELPFGLESFQLFGELDTDIPDRFLLFPLVHDEMLRRKQECRFLGPENLLRDRIDHGDRRELPAGQLEQVDELFRDRHHLDTVPHRPERPR